MNKVDAYVVFLSRDLMFYSKVSTAAKQAGFQAISVPSLDKIVERGVTAEVRWIIVDLFQKPIDIASIGGLAKELCPQAQLVAYGPHVDKTELELARQSGFDDVLTRGEFNHRLPTIFTLD